MILEIGDISSQFLAALPEIMIFGRRAFISRQLRHTTLPPHTQGFCNVLAGRKCIHVLPIACDNDIMYKL
jgi:hypothetical protein